MAWQPGFRSSHARSPPQRDASNQLLSTFAGKVNDAASATNLAACSQVSRKSNRKRTFLLAIVHLQQARTCQPSYRQLRFQNPELATRLQPLTDRRTPVTSNALTATSEIKLKKQQPGAVGNIVVGLDFSPASDLALQYAAAIARQYQGQLHLVHAVQPHAYEEPETLPPETEERLREALERMQATTRRLGNIPYRIYAKHGYAAEVLALLAKSSGADLMVVGTHGASGLKKLALGSVAEQVFRQAPCPVLTVGPKAPDPADKVELREILYTTNLLSESYEALRYALCLAEAGSARLTLLHVLEASKPDTAVEYEAIVSPCRKRLQRMIPAEAQLSSAPRFRVEFGLAALDVILQVAAELPSDLLVMDVRRAEAWVSHLPDKACQLIARAPCPVLTVVEKRGAGGASFE